MLHDARLERRPDFDLLRQVLDFESVRTRHRRRRIDRQGASDPQDSQERQRARAELVELFARHGQLGHHGRLQHEEPVPLVYVR